MNLHSHSAGGQPVVPLQQKWQLQVREWRNLIAQCTRKPSRKRVHGLRSFTLRLQVALERSLLEQTPEPIRDADVYLARLGGLHSTQRGSNAGGPNLKPRCLLEIDELENCLRQQRQIGIDKLKAAIDARGKRLKRRCKEMETVLAAQIPSTAVSTAQTASQIFAEMVNDLTDLDSSNLHAFRKRLKRALYIAEMSAASDPQARKLAAVFRKMHLASGAWHDWQALALEAGRILPGCDRENGVVPMLEKLANGALKKAVGLCRRSTAHFLRNAGDVRHSQSRKPVDSVPADRTCNGQASSKIAS